LAITKEIQSGAVSDVEKGMLGQLLLGSGKFDRVTKEQLDRAAQYTVNFTDEQIRQGKEAADSWEDLTAAMRGASDVIGSQVAPAMREINKLLADTIKSHPDAAAVFGSIGLAGAAWGGLKTVRGMLGGGAAAAAGGGLLGPALLGLGAGAAALGIRSLTGNEDVEGSGYGAHFTGGRSSAQVMWGHLKEMFGGGAGRGGGPGMLYGPQLPGTGEHNY
jgi:hypothetical protein